MALRTRAKETVQVQFNEVRSSGVFIAQRKANHKDSMSLLQQNGFRPLTYQEALVKIDQNPELKEQLKVKWFYLGSKGPQLSGYYTFNDKGELRKGEGDIEKSVYVLKGSQPLSLDVLADDDARDNVGRFVLGAGYGPSDASQVVVGVRIGHEVAAPKTEAEATTDATKTVTIGSELVSEFKSAVAKTEGVVDRESSRVFREVLRKLEE